MARNKQNGNGVPATTAQALGSLIKSARDIMRKDKGLNGDLDRLPLLTWIMFLKFLDDLEQQREDEAQLGRKIGHRAALPVAGLGSQSARHHRGRASLLHQPRRGTAAGRQTRTRTVRLPARPVERERR